LNAYEISEHDEAEIHAAIDAWEARK